MKHLICLIQNTRRMAVLGLLSTGLGVGLHAGDTKPFKATGAVDPAMFSQDPVTLAFSGPWRIVPEKCTGRFAGATGQGTMAGDAVSLTYTMTGEITTPGGAGKTD